MSAQHQINNIMKKLQEVEYAIEDIKMNVRKISKQVSDIENTSGGDGYLADYSAKRVTAIIDEINKAIEFLDKDDNLTNPVEVQTYFSKLSSRLSKLTLIFEIYYALRITNLMALRNDKYMELIALDRTMAGFYFPEDAFEELIDKKEYVNLRIQLSKIKETYHDVSKRWNEILD
jgi:hypothetical protein